MVMAEVWLGLLQPVALLPNVAFYTVGLQSSLFGLNAHFALGGYLFWIQVTFFSICQCLLFRWFVIVGRKIR
ncbi:unnamed protein product, partial [Mesorhabditis belari]|uniref:Uncharacterized protein n=1 Tax=Mesorhabditis belari TaxID=2138241 RepID=A0AAF3J5E5_9BILA